MALLALGISPVWGVTISDLVRELPNEDLNFQNQGREPGLEVMPTDEDGVTRTFWTISVSQFQSWLEEREEYLPSDPFRLGIQTDSGEVFVRLSLYPRGATESQRESKSYGLYIGLCEDLPPGTQLKMTYSMQLADHPDHNCESKCVLRKAGVVNGVKDGLGSFHDLFTFGQSRVVTFIVDLKSSLSKSSPSPRVTRETAILSPGNSWEIPSALRQFQIEVAWNEMGSADIDLDLYAFVIDANGDLCGQITHKSKIYRNDALQLHEDVRRGGGEGEKMDVRLNRMRDEDHLVVLAVKVAAPPESSFLMIRDCVTRVKNLNAHDNDPLVAQFHLSCGDGYETNYLVVGYLQRTADNWRFHTVGQSTEDLHAVVDMARKNWMKCVPCPCGAMLQRIAAGRAYSRGVVCNVCGKAASDSTAIFHCLRGRNKTHPLGYDLCADCADRIQLTWTISGETFRGWLEKMEFGQYARSDPFPLEMQTDSGEISVRLSLYPRGSTESHRESKSYGLYIGLCQDLPPGTELMMAYLMQLADRPDLQFEATDVFQKSRQVSGPPDADLGSIDDLLALDTITFIVYLKARLVCTEVEQKMTSLQATTIEQNKVLVRWVIPPDCWRRWCEQHWTKQRLPSRPINLQIGGIDAPFRLILFVKGATDEQSACNRYGFYLDWKLPETIQRIEFEYSFDLDGDESEDHTFSANATLTNTETYIIGPRGGLGGCGDLGESKDDEDIVFRTQVRITDAVMNRHVGGDNFLQIVYPEHVQASEFMDDSEPLENFAAAPCPVVRHQNAEATLIQGEDRKIEVKLPENHDNKIRIERIGEMHPEWWSCIGLIKFRGYSTSPRYPDGMLLRGSACVFQTPHMNRFFYALTAAHNCKTVSRSSRTYNIHDTWGMVFERRLITPDGHQIQETYNVTRIMVHDKYAPLEQDPFSYDLAVLQIENKNNYKFPNVSKLKSSIGPRSDDFLHVSGYPVSKIDQLWTNDPKETGSYEESFSKETWVYNIDTEGGQSGGPAWIARQKEGRLRMYQIGVHSGSSGGYVPPDNEAVRITHDKLKWINNAVEQMDVDAGVVNKRNWWNGYR